MASNEGGAVKGKVGGGKFHLKGDMTKIEKGEPGQEMHKKHHKGHHSVKEGAHHKNRMHMKAHGK